MPGSRFTRCLFILLPLLIFCLAPLPAPSSCSAETADTSLSPYFFVESENAAENSGENFPLLDTQAKVQIRERQP